VGNPAPQIVVDRPELSKVTKEFPSFRVAVDFARANQEMGSSTPSVAPDTVKDFTFHCAVLIRILEDAVEACDTSAQGLQMAVGYAGINYASADSLLGQHIRLIRWGFTGNGVRDLPQVINMHANITPPASKGPGEADAYDTDYIKAFFAGTRPESVGRAMQEMNKAVGEFSALADRIAESGGRLGRAWQSEAGELAAGAMRILSGAADGLEVAATKVGTTFAAFENILAWHKHWLQDAVGYGGGRQNVWVDSSDVDHDRAREYLRRFLGQVHHLDAELYNVEKELSKVRVPTTLDPDWDITGPEDFRGLLVNTAEDPRDGVLIGRDGRPISTLEDKFIHDNADLAFKALSVERARDNAVREPTEANRVAYEQELRKLREMIAQELRKLPGTP